MTPSPGSDPFRLSMSPMTAERIRRLSDLAAADHQMDAFITALRHIDSRLRNDPLNFGEELFDLRQYPATVKLAVRLPIAIEFGVFPEQRIVLIRSFDYLKPGFPSRSDD